MNSQNGYLAPYLRSFFEDYLICRRNVSANTIESYRDGLKLFLLYASEALRKPPAMLLVADVAESVVLGFLNHLESTRSNSIQTRNLRLTVLRCLFQYISRREPMLLDHCRRVLTIPMKRGAVRREIRYLEKRELHAVLDAVDRSTALGRRDYAMLLFMYNTGARVQETADTQVSRLTLERPFKVELLGKGRKWRTCPLWDGTAYVLKVLVAERGIKLGDDVHLFTSRLERPMSRSAIADVVRKYAELAARRVPSLRKKSVTPHTLRHTTAMHLLQSGVEINVIRSWLGHVSIVTTNHYVEIDLEMKAKALKTCRIADAAPARGRWNSDSGILAWLEGL